MMSPMVSMEKDLNELVGWGLSKQAALREVIADVEDALFSLPDHIDGNDFPLEHTFCNGMYVRQIFIPKGYLIVGKLHKQNHLVMIGLGDVSVLTEDGAVRIKGPSVPMPAKAGTKRIAYAHEDTLWFNIHRTDSTNLQDIETELIAPNYAALEC